MKTPQANGIAETPKSPLDQLDGLAAQADADHLGALPDGALIADQPAPVDYATEAAGGVDMFAAMVGGYCPPAGALFTDDKKRAIVAAMVPVMEKYNFTFGALPCEVVLAIVAGPVLYQASKLVAKQMREESEQAKPAAAAKAVDAPEQAPETKRHPQESLYPA